MTRMPSGPVETAGAWRGCELRDRPAWWTYELTERDRHEVRRALGGVAGRALHTVSALDFPLPTFGPRLCRVTRDLTEGFGFGLLRGFPTDGLALDDITRLYFGSLAHVGIPIAQSPRNDLVGDVRDEGDERARGYQTSRALGYHSDSADLVALLCLRPAASGGVSRILSAVAVHNTILKERPDLLTVLYDEPFYCSWAGQQPAGQPPYYWSRFYSWHHERLHTSGIKERYVDDPPLSERQQEAIAFVREILDRDESILALDMDLQPGDIQVLDNSVVWHSRTAFVDATDPAQRRHLLRMWLNLHEERPVAPDFANRYEMVGQRTASPKRRLFDVPICDIW